MNKTLRAVELKVNETLTLINAEWENNPAVRTPRLADAVNLLERAMKKIAKEAAAEPRTNADPKGE